VNCHSRRIRCQAVAAESGEPVFTSMDVVGTGTLRTVAFLTEKRVRDHLLRPKLLLHGLISSHSPSRDTVPLNKKSQKGFFLISDAEPQIFKTLYQSFFLVSSLDHGNMNQKNYKSNNHTRVVNPDTE
jgi:hypothetical protein